MNACHHTIHHRGFTITELLVTLAITSILALGAVTFLTSADQSNRLQMAISSLNASGRFGLEKLSRDIRMSGYRSSEWTLGALANAVTATDGAAATGGDSITLLSEGARDCNFAPTVDGLANNTYQVVDGNLECNGLSVTGGIQELQIYLGEDTDSNTVANRWLSPGTAGLDMTRVVSVRIHLLVRTDSDAFSSGAQAYYFDNALQPAIHDGQIRREYSVTVALRNPG